MGLDLFPWVLLLVLEKLLLLVLLRVLMLPLLMLHIALSLRLFLFGGLAYMAL